MGASTWASGSATTAGLVDITSAQTISGAKTLTNSLVFNAQNEARFADADSSNYVALRSPSVVASNVIFTLPNALGTNGQVLSTNATGDLSWLSAGTVTSVTGTAPISVATGTTTPVISMAKATAGADGYLSSGDWSIFNAKLGTATTFSGDVSGTSSTMTLATVATAGTYSRVTVDAKGRVTAGTISQDLTVVTGTLGIANGGTGQITANAALNAFLPAQAASSVLQSNGTNTSWLTYSASASNSTLAQRDGSGVINSNGFSITNTGTISVVAPAAASTHTLTLPGSQGAAGTQLTNNGSGGLTWGAATGGSVDLTTNVTGALPVGNGGTGITSGTSGGIPYFSAASTIASSAALTQYGVVYGGGAGAAPVATALGGTDSVLRMPAAAGPPAFGSIDLSKTNAVGTSILPIANGGTGAATTSAGFVFAGPASGAAAAPSFRALVSTDISAGAGYVNGGNSFSADATIGVNSNFGLVFKTNNVTRGQFTAAGAFSVSSDATVGTAGATEGVVPASVGKLKVNGQAWSAVQTSAVASPLAWDANNGNVMVWTNDTAGPTVNITNMQPGAAYMLVVKSAGAGTGTVLISCNGFATTATAFVPVNGNRVNGTKNKTIYTLLWDGTDCLVTWITGY